MERAQNLPIFFSGNDIERSVNLAAHQIDVGDTLKPLIFVVFLCVRQLAQPPSSNR